MPDTANAALSFQFDLPFSGTGPSSPKPWAFANLAQNGANAVTVTISLRASCVSGIYLDWFGLNYNPNGNASALTVSGPGITDAIAVYESVNNGTGDKLKADGDGYYDIVLNFPNRGADRFGSGETYSFTIHGPPGGNVTPESFDFLSEKGGGAGAWLAAAHLAGYGSSVWVAGTPVTPVPEANFGLAGGGLLVCWALGTQYFRRQMNRL